MKIDLYNSLKKSCLSCTLFFHTITLTFKKNTLKHILEDPPPLFKTNTAHGRKRGLLYINTQIQLCSNTFGFFYMMLTKKTTGILS